MTVAEWIQSTCAVAALALAVYSLEPARRAQLRESLRAVTSTILTGLLYLLLIVLIGLYGSEIVAFGRKDAPIQRFEVIDLIVNFIAICAFVWCCFYLYANLGRGTKKNP